MNVVEFQATAHDGVIDLPIEQQRWNGKKIRVILLEDIANKQEKESPVFSKKDVTKNMQVIKKGFDETLCDNTALIHIKESSEYIHNLRRSLH